MTASKHPDYRWAVLYDPDKCTNDRSAKEAPPILILKFGCPCYMDLCRGAGGEGADAIEEHSNWKRREEKNELCLVKFELIHSRSGSRYWFELLEIGGIAPASVPRSPANSSLVISLPSPSYRFRSA